MLRLRQKLERDLGEPVHFRTLLARVTGSFANEMRWTISGKVRYQDPLQVAERATSLVPPEKGFSQYRPEFAPNLRKNQSSSRCRLSQICSRRRPASLAASRQNASAKTWLCTWRPTRRWIRSSPK